MPVLEFIKTDHEKAKKPTAVKDELLQYLAAQAAELPSVGIGAPSVGVSGVQAEECEGQAAQEGESEDPGAQAEGNKAEDIN